MTLPPDFDEATAATWEAVRPFTMTSAERVHALCHAVRYVVRYDIPGDIVECGVWRGGSMLAVARTLAEMGRVDRDLYLFDTYEGMTPPTDLDARHDGMPADQLLAAAERTEDVWADSPIDEVRATLARADYPAARVHFVEGRVEDTVPAGAPSRIALLRLDTDWYESTRHELEHLIPRVSPNGVLIIDDYGFWAGARRAVDEFLAVGDRPILLNRIDDTGRIAVLP